MWVWTHGPRGPRWEKADSKTPHPTEPGYVLAGGKKVLPTWVTVGTARTFGTTRRAKAKAALKAAQAPIKAEQNVEDAADEDAEIDQLDEDVEQDEEEWAHAMRFVGIPANGKGKGKKAKAGGRSR